MIIYSWKAESRRNVDVLQESWNKPGVCFFYKPAPQWTWENERRFKSKGSPRIDPASFSFLLQDLLHRFFFCSYYVPKTFKQFFFYTVRSESCRWWRSTMSNVLHGQKKVYQTIPCLVTGVLPLSFVAVMCVFLQCEHSVPLKKDIKCTFSGSGKGTNGARFMVSLKWQLKFNKLFLLKVYR